MNRHILVGLADTHAGHALGLCNPDTQLWDIMPDGDIEYRSPTLGLFQQYSWPFYLQIVEEVRRFAAGDPITMIHNGDLTHGDKYTKGVTETAIHNQQEIGLWNLKPWFSLSTLHTVRLVTGTDSHTFNSSSEITVARLLAAEYSDRDIKAVNHLLLDLDGAVCDIAHHGAGTGGRYWLQGNQLRYYIRDLMLKELAAGSKPPSILLRAHHHRWIPHETVRLYFAGTFYETTAIALPSMCGMTSFARQVTRSEHTLTLGIVIIEIIDGAVARIRPMLRFLDLRTKEEIGSV